MPKFVLNGKEIEFKQGQTIIEAALESGVEIPHFCWHPKLSVSGNCRVCLVEVEKMPKLVIACSTIAAEGMVVHSESEKTLAARNAVMEFILINHPLDCPICDEAGECKLQDYAYEHSVGESRFDEEKQHKDKRVELGQHVMFDGERCISCSRCIRFCDEIAGTGELTFVKRGDRVTIVTYPGKEMNNPYSLNTTDICPVGALTNRDFRFKARVWDMSFTKTICSGCARGCNIEIGVRNNEILRLHPRHNEDVNSYWMCDSGRLDTWKFVNDNNRIDGPFVRKDGNLQKVGWDEAYSAAVSKLKSFKKNEIAFIGSAFATNEDNYLLNKFAHSVFGSGNLDFFRHIIPGSGDNILIREDKTPNSLGAELSGVVPSKEGINSEKILSAINEGKIKALYVIEEDIASISEEAESILAKLDLLLVHSYNENKTTALADIVFPASTYAEKNGTFVNFQGRVQRIRPAVTTLESDRGLDGLAMSRLDKFGTQYDRWASGRKIDAKPSWKIISTLANAMGQKFKFNMAEDVFAEMSGKIEAFKEMDYDSIGELGALIKTASVVEKV